jgi:hypothetical protein
MIRGMSREKPADVPARLIERIWSVYDVRGERIKLWVVSIEANGFFGWNGEWNGTRLGRRLI